MKFFLHLLYISTATLVLVSCGETTKMDEEIIDENQTICAQVITHAYNPETNEEKDFPTPCDVPESWIVGTPPDDNNETNDSIVCIQVITHAHNPETNEEKNFPTPCDVPEGWVVGFAPDIIPPIITLLGDNVVNVTVGDTYIDAGATAEDNKDGNITVKIMTSNNVDTGTDGTYIVTYNVKDDANNSAVEVSRTIIVNNSVKKDYAALGEHEVSRYPAEGLVDDYVVYYPKDAITEDMPVILFLEGGGTAPKIDHYSGLMQFMASQGYFVIGAESGESYASSLATSIFDKALNAAKEAHNLNISKLSIMGHSQGGGQAFYTMKYFRDKGYGNEASLVISIDGWFAFSMNESDLIGLNSKVAFIQMNGVSGTGTDPRIHLSIWNLLDESTKTFLTLPENDHGYVAGDLEAMLGKEDMLEIIGGLTDDAFFAKEEGYASIPDGHKASYHDIYSALKDKDMYSADCAGDAYNASAQLNLYDIDYCNMRQFVSIPTNTNLSKPDYLASYVEPAFDTNVTRITDRENQSGNAHPYPKTQAWNSDMTRIRLGYRLYDAKSFEESVITEQELIDGQVSEMKWSTKDPNVFYGIDKGLDDVYRFTKATIGTDNIMYEYPISFSKSIYDEFLLGKYEGNIDFNDQYVVFAARLKGKNFLTAIVYDIQNNVVVNEENLSNVIWYKEDAEGNFVVNSTSSNQIFDWISVSPLGKYVLLNWKNEPENNNSSIRASIHQYDIHLNYIRKLADHGNHGDMGLDDEGKEVYVQFGFGNDREGKDNRAIWSYPLDGSERLSLLPSKYNGGHVSCRNYNLKGWCYLSTTEEGFREVLAVKLDGTGAVKRFAQTHFTNDVENSDGSNVGVSPDGQKVIFKSNWGEDGGVWDSYHVEFTTP